MRPITFLLLCFSTLLWSFSLMACNSTPLTCINGTLSTSLNPSQRPCESDCDCNTFTYTGTCTGGVCKSTKRESCKSAGAKRACVPSGSTTCQQGIQTCQDEGLQDLVWGNCKAAAPVGEKGATLCQDGIDNDCDGKVDLADPDCKDVCAPGSKRPCYTGTTETRETGSCRSGAQTCNDQGQWGTTCDGEVLPQPETCNAKDDDCDGQIDEDIPNCSTP